LPITLGVSVHAFAAPFAFLANSDVQSIDILDIASRSVIAQVPLELTPTAIAINRHNTAAFITSEKRGLISTLDVNSLEISNVMKIDGNPYAIVCDPTRERIYVSDRKRGAVHVIDTTDDSID